MDNLWECFYCGLDSVRVLPNKCPECGTLLTKPFSDLTTKEFYAAVNKRADMGYPMKPLGSVLSPSQVAA